MKALSLRVVKMGGGFLKAIFGQTRNGFTGGWDVDSVFGSDEAELAERLRIRLPEFKAVIRREYESGRLCAR